MDKQSSVTLAVRQGPRSDQEDRNFFMRIENSGCEGWLMAVMDGHSGSYVAELCRQEAKDLFRLSSVEQSEQALRNLVEQLNIKSEHFKEGSTLSAALGFDDPRKAPVAILGDSPVVVYDVRGETWVSPEHNVRSSLKEKKAAEQRGGYVRDGYLYARGGDEGLQLSRALGDAYLAGVISREPEIFTIADPRWILVASDGLLDPSHGLFDPSHGNTHNLLEEIRFFAQRSATAEDLMKWAEKRGLRDNATALVWCA